MPSTPSPGMGCSNCIYRLADQRQEYSQSGYCRRLPPQMVAVTSPNGDMLVEQHYPWVSAGDWCGEHHYSDR